MTDPRLTAAGQPASDAALSDAERIKELERRNADLRELLGHCNCALEEEKRVLARELHDAMGSSLSALNMYLALLQHELPDHAAVAKRVTQMKTMVLSVTDAARRMQGRLRPEKLDVFGLKIALEEYAGDFSRRTGIACRTSLPDEELDFPSEYNIALFRISEEALSNIAQHANASHAELILDQSDEGVMLTIRDNGSGLGTGQADPLLTHGLRAIRERASYLGGALKLGVGQHGQGTTITICLPSGSGALASNPPE